jgi:uncharacterized HAD superfamily protein
MYDLEQRQIGIDMDGPIANTDPVLRYLLSKRIKRTIHQHEVTDWHYWQCIPEVTEEMVYSALDEFHSEWLLKVPIVPGAVYGINELYRRGYNLSVVTFRSESVRTDTGKFLKNHGVDIPLIISPSTSKVQVCLDNNIFVMIEDRYETAVALANAGIQVLMTSFPWNIQKPQVDGIRRVYSWVDIIDCFEKGYVKI